jgi:uncharacterized protein (TIGR04255 family)
VSEIGRSFLETVHEEYPTPTQLRAEQVTFGIGLPSPEFSPVSRRGWRVASADGAWIVLLLPDSVSIETTAFTYFGEFEARLTRLMATVDDLLQPTLNERLGLRFVNLLPPLDSEHSKSESLEIGKWSAVLAEPFQGPAKHPGFAGGMQHLDARMVLEAEPGLKAGVRWSFGSSSPEGVLLDIDVFRDVPEVFSIDDVISTANRCNDVAVQVFGSAVSSETLEQLARPSS